MTIGKVVSYSVINNANSAVNKVHFVNLATMLIQSDFNVSF